MESKNRNQIDIEAADIDEDLFDDPDENDIIPIEPDIAVRKSRRFIDSDDDDDQDSDKP